jgi:GxxExxY protein
MQMDKGDAPLLEPVTERIIGCAFRVANTPGHGFVEKVYENALAHELRKCGLGVVQQRRIVVLYDDMMVGEFTADLLIEDQVILELKVVPALSDVHIPQLPARHRQAPVPANQLRPPQSRNPPHHPPSLTAKNPLHPFLSRVIRLKKRPAPPQPYRTTTTSSSATTLKLTSVFGPNALLIGTSTASRPRAISTRP